MTTKDRPKLILVEALRYAALELSEYVPEPCNVSWDPCRDRSMDVIRTFVRRLPGSRDEWSKGDLMDALGIQEEMDGYDYGEEEHPGID